MLLDTHALLWWQRDDPQLGATARAMMSDRDNEVLVSAVSLWEIVVKVRIGKLRANIGEVTDAAAQDGFTPLGIRTAHLRVLATLPAHHRDPFDHLLISQAIAEDAVLLSDDRRMPNYPVKVHACAG